MGVNDEQNYSYAASHSQKMDEVLIVPSEVNESMEAVIKGRDDFSVFGFVIFKKEVEMRHKPGDVALKYTYRNGYVCCPSSVLEEGRILLSNISMIDAIRFTSNKYIFAAIGSLQVSIIFFILYGVGFEGSASDTETEESSFDDVSNVEEKKHGNPAFLVFAIFLLLSTVGYLIAHFCRSTSVLVRIYQAGASVLPSLKISYESKSSRDVQSVIHDIDLITNCIHKVRQSENYYPEKCAMQGADIV